MCLQESGVEGGGCSQGKSMGGKVGTRSTRRALAVTDF